MQRVGFLVFTLIFLSACNGNDSSTASVDPNVIGSGTGSIPGGAVSSPTPSATATPRASATPLPSVTPSPTAAPTATPISTACVSQKLTFKILNSIARSTSGLTEGFFYDQGVIYESTGAIAGHGASVLNAINPSSGKVTKLYTTPSSSFGEGLIKLGGYFYQLTYLNGRIYKYTSDGTAAGTKLVGTYTNPLSEGWGLTTDGTNLLATDGSSYLYRISPSTLKVLSKVKVVTPAGKAVSSLNELEYVNGEIYANIFPGNKMVRFNAISGCQTGEIDLTALYKKLGCPSSALECATDSVTNGIAYDASSGAFYLTGKSWPVIFKGQF